MLVCALCPPCSSSFSFFLFFFHYRTKLRNIFICPLAKPVPLEEEEVVVAVVVVEEEESLLGMEWEMAGAAGVWAGGMEGRRVQVALSEVVSSPQGTPVSLWQPE